VKQPSARGKAFSGKRWRADLLRALNDVEVIGVPECVHRLRVSLARLQVWLWLGEHRRLARETRWLRRRAGALRDLDVQRMVGAAGARFTARRRKRRRAAWASLCADLEGDRARALLTDLAKVKRPARWRAQRRLSRLVARALARGAKLEGRWDDAARLHALRQAVRKVRYALDCAGQPVGEVAALQSALGDAHDLAIARSKRGGQALEPRLLSAQREAHRRWGRAQRALERSLEK
jgi:CHAD domain-containing protein